MINSISVLNFDNSLFTRTLTARVLGVNNSDIIRWSFPDNTVAQTTAFTPYTSNSAALVSQAGTLIFSFSASTYDYKTTTYTLCTLPLSCTQQSTATTVTTSILYDTFPNIDLTLYINFERTDNSSYFYRLTSTHPLTGSSLLNPYFINLVSSSYNLGTSLTGSNYNTWYSLNNSNTRLTNIFELTGFNRTPTTRLSSVQAVLSATSAPGSLTPFWSPHVLKRSLSAVFVPYFLSGDFVGYPKGYFKNRKDFDILSPTALENSPGLRFYGEGHTETINLSSGNTDPRATRYIWRLDNSVTKYPVSSNIPNQPLLSAYITLPTQIGVYPTIPISLHLTNSLFLSTDPYYYYDDATGRPTYYPYYISTVDIDGNEITPRNKLKESIKVLPYDQATYTFIPGIAPTIYLPINESQINYTSFLQTSLVDTIGAIDPTSLQPCYGLYGIIWNWLSFYNCAITPETYTNKPSSWETTALTATFPKRWEYQQPLSADLFLTSPVSCSATNVTWLLSTVLTHYTEQQPSLFTNQFNYSLALKGEGGEQYLSTNNGTGITLNNTNPTNILLSAHSTNQCIITAVFTNAATQAGYTNDWQLKNTDIDVSYNIVSVPSDVIKLYTSNRFVLTGADVEFENLSIITDSITAIKIDFDDSIVAFLTGNEVRQNFKTSYANEGVKNLQITLYSSNRTTPETVKFPNIIRVLNEYDEVSPTEYRSTITPLQIPWPERPQIGSNDWAVEDNINHWFKKFFDNLYYLDTRGRTYDSESHEYFGYLGGQPTATGNLTGCEIWTWEDLDCFNTLLPEPVTWRDVLSAESPTDTNGKYVNLGCATWRNYECTYSQVSPTCYALHNLEWSWKLRKRGNSLTPVTWKQTQCVKYPGEFPKTWAYQAPTNEPVLVCSEPDWHVNIPGIDQYYNLIGKSKVENRCIYYGIASRNNKLYVAHKNQIKLLNSNRDATFYDYEDTIDEVTEFSSIKNICIDSNNKIYILDNIRSQVTVYTYEQDTLGRNFKLFTIWGGFGSAKSNSKFSNPNDLHIDQLDNIWVTDTGNSCVKLYSNTGYWIRTILDEKLKQETPLSTTVDSQKNVHILTKNSIRVYTYNGEFLFSYSFKEFTTREPRKIISSYNREVIYFATDTQVLKYFRNGVFFSYIIKDRNDISNITGMYHDEYRNLLILANDKVLKYPDIMIVKRLKGTIPNNFWTLEDVFIHKEEYIQNWVYTKAFQRMWDNIEIFRNTIFYNNTYCQGYKAPIYGKEKMIVGQNEIVTATTINRVLGYLWENLSSIFDYFNPSCEEK